MSASDDRVRAALSEIPFPGYRKSVVDLGLVQSVAIEGGVVRVRLTAGPGGSFNHRIAIRCGKQSSGCWSIRMSGRRWGNAVDRCVRSGSRPLEWCRITLCG